MVQRYRSLARRLALVRLAVALGAPLALAGCLGPAPRPELPANPSSAAPSPGPQSMPPATPAPQPPRPPQPLREAHLSPATRSLVAQAHEQLARADLDGASLTLDRALRIEPNSPLIWSELGKLRLAESDSHQAEVCARKALALASGDRAAQTEASRVLIDALRAQGRNQEAHEIEARAFIQ
jgi:tetratricopeptide (TPR) repeat protein